jgi:hypothetical protein
MDKRTGKNMDCPICGMDNNCCNLTDMRQEECWCNKELFPSGIFNNVPSDQLRKSCICKDCLDKFREKAL